MPYTMHQGGDAEIMDILNGAIRVTLTPGGLPVGGRTVIFTTPVATVTFSGAVGAVLSHREIFDELVAAGVAGLVLGRRATPTGGATLLLSGAVVIASTGTANPFLGLDAVSPTTITAVDPTKIALLSTTAQSSQYVLILAP